MCAFSANTGFGLYKDFSDGILIKTVITIFGFSRTKNQSFTKCKKSLQSFFLFCFFFLNVNANGELATTFDPHDSHSLNNLCSFAHVMVVKGAFFLLDGCCFVVGYGELSELYRYFLLLVS